MSTGLRYKSKLATPGEPGARPRARAHSFVPAARTPLTVCLGLSPARRPGPGPRPDPRPHPTPQRTSRYVCAVAHLARCHPLCHQRAAPQRDPAPAGRHSALSR